MGVFDDKKYQELDWISQATEPVETELTKILALLPDETPVTFKWLDEMVGDTGLYINNQRFLRSLLNDIDDQGVSRTVANMHYQDYDRLLECFEFQVDPGTQLNFETKELTGAIRFVKIKFTFDENTLKEILAQKAMAEFERMSYYDVDWARMNDIAELIGKCDKYFSTRSPRGKFSAIHARVRQLFVDNEWNIKDADLAAKVCKWIRLYATKGDGAAYVNFCKLKVMTHKGLPIYSIEEQV